MRNRIMLFCFVAVVVAVSFTTGVFAWRSISDLKTTTQTQQETTAAFVEVAIKVGLDNGLVDFIKSTLHLLEKDPGFQFGVVYDDELTQLLILPSSAASDADLETRLSLIVDQQGADFVSETIKIGSDTFYFQSLKDDDGELIGFVNLSYSDKVITAKANSALINALVIGLLVVTPILLLFTRWLAVFIAPLSRLTKAIDTFADGDYSIELHETKRRDEIGKITTALAAMKEQAIERAEERHERVRLREVEAKQAADERKAEMNGLADAFEAEVLGVVHRVAASATDMQVVAQQVSGAAKTSETEALSVASTASNTAENVETISTASEQMLTSIEEIGQQTEQATSMTRGAAEQAGATREQIESLVATVDRVGEVVSLISDIAKKTNLLALNATIEAARAGEAGKGFAVVANEVKMLASQTNHATDDIASLLGDIQTATGASAASVRKINQVIEDVNQVATAIASAVEEQGATTGDITQNVRQAAEGTRSVNNTITGVSQAASQTGVAASKVVEASVELQDDSEKLKAAVDGFLKNVRID